VNRSNESPRTREGERPPARPAPSPLRWRTVAAIGLIGYGALAAVPAVRNFDLIDGDTVAYIRLARYLLAGHFWDAASSMWSPLLSWCMVPLLAVGLDSLHACRIVLLAWGAGFVLAFALLLERFSPITRAWQVAAILLASALAAHWAISISQPDLMVATLLMVYFWCVLDSRLLHSRRRQLACGVLGGAAYLAKAYALPFFLAHYAFVLALRGY
jgi:hypothetical protein